MRSFVTNNTKYYKQDSYTQVEFRISSTTVQKKTPELSFTDDSI